MSTIEYEIASTAARFSMSIQDFKARHGEDQSRMLAFFRTEKAVEAVLAYEMNKEISSKRISRK